MTDRFRHTAHEISTVRGAMQDAIQNGMPEVGWRGDPLLQLVWDGKYDGWVILDRAFTPPKPVLRRKYNGLRDLDYRKLCEILRDNSFEGNGSDTIQDRINRHNDRLIEQGEERTRELIDETSEELAFYLQRGLG